MNERDPLLVEREKTHGSFKENADIWDKLIRINMNDPFKSNPPQRLALCMISLKIARILSGQANVKDHWDDIAGYAKLGSEACD